MIEYMWRPITDLPDDWQDLGSVELTSLAEIWEEQKGRLLSTEALRHFNRKLQRQWAIETGIIEGLYTIDRGVTRILIERGIDASLIPHGTTDKPVGRILPIIKDQQAVIEGLFDFVGQTRQLSTSYIKELHQVLTAHQFTTEGVDSSGHIISIELLRGEYKKLPNSPTTADGSLHQYCPPEQVASEMDKLIEMHRSHQNLGVSPEIEAAWLHHRFTQIHPFQDGNGRVARAIASLVLLRAGWFPLVVVSDQHRDDYIRALEDADRGELSNLTALFARLQKKSLIHALSLSDEVISQQESLASIIGSAARRIHSREANERTEKRKVFDIAAELERSTIVHFEAASAELKVQLASVGADYRVDIHRDSADNRHWFWSHAVAIAGEFSYFADLRSYHGWVRLCIRKTGERQTEIVVSFHSLGPEFVGVMMANAFTVHRIPSEDGVAIVDGPYTACHEPFQFSYNQSSESVLARFEKWIGSALLLGLDLWRRQI